MTNIIFKQGLKENLPTTAEAGTLLFTTDTGEIYRGAGNDKPLLPFATVLFGFDNLADLQSKNPAIESKLYLTGENKLYSYIGNTYQLVAGAETMGSDKIIFDPTDTDLESENIQDVVVELNDKIEAVDTKVTELESNQGKVKVSESDTFGYIGDKLQSTTLQYADGVIKVINVDGLTIGVSDINTWLTGTEANIQSQINDVKDSIESLSVGLNYIGNFDTLALLTAYAEPLNGDLAVVTNTDSGEAGELYVYKEDGATWTKLGKFEFSETFIGLKDTPTSYDGSTGKVLKSDGSKIVFADINYEDVLGKPEVSVADIEDAVSKKHEHVNNAVLDKLGEDSEGNLTFNGSPVAPQWGSFEF